MQLEKVYDPQQSEKKWYPFWESNGFFTASVNPDRDPYTIVIPPPNVTGVLHMGHILNNTLQDTFIRYARMMGREACWIPGMDHAGIATQNVVEKALRQEGKTRHDLGRDEFVKEVWKWKEKYGGVITTQLRELGVSCDWSRERFTMDETLSAAVREAFVRLYEDGLIYKGKYVINWCPKDHTAISDDEVEYEEVNGKLYFIHYPVKDHKENGLPPFITVATTRPETMLGDVAVAVNPSDERYSSLVGATVVLPLTRREIPVVADDFVDPSFGTGIVKVTPAHDPNDYWIGKRHDLPMISVLDQSAHLTDEVPEEFRGLERFEARKQILDALAQGKHLGEIRDHVHNVGHCYRCSTVIEPYLSDQWFVRMKPLAGPALEAVMNGTIRFHPDRWTKVYEHWMTSIRDWCISRQLWWGHRIPVWYCVGDEICLPECREPIVSRDVPAACPACGSENLRQDEDVLDTWFSSWLWPFSVHHWPNEAKTGTDQDLRYFYPTSTLVTGPDIIFFWVARMVMSGLKFGPSFSGKDGVADNVPFRDVYFTSIIRDDEGRKMSKSLGNSPEPLDLIREYGADAVRFTILFLSPLGQDVHYAKEKNEIGRNFANKIWNAGRFLAMNKEQTGEAGDPTDHLDLADRWILSRFHSTLREVRTGLDQFDVNRIARIIYDFLWHDFCDWYVEMVKSRLYGDDPVEVKQAVIRRSLDVFDGALRLLHPLMPFVTEELWQNIRVRKKGESIMVTQQVMPDPSLIDREVETEMAFVQKVIDAIRNIRGELSIPPGTWVEIILKENGSATGESLRKYSGYLERLARVRELRFTTDRNRPPQSASAIVDGEEIFVPLEGVIDLAVERGRIGKEIVRLQGLRAGIEKKLANERFLEKAPHDVVEKERTKLASLTATLEKLDINLRALSNPGS
ncbi:MAG: valine--tRNA ligase [Ignavibacteria bacterium]|nr:valine--tRNA ligase [Ignavibacteria bacterium]